jgi:hypothetical protein
MCEISILRTGAHLRKLFEILLANPEGPQAGEALKQLSASVKRTSYCTRAPARLVLRRLCVFRPLPLTSRSIRRCCAKCHLDRRRVETQFKPGPNADDGEHAMHGPCRRFLSVKIGSCPRLLDRR